jgi:ABC-type Mn2+/Zn2+ transport system ATPase subunit
MLITIKSLSKESIFCPEYKALTTNNIINVKNKNIAVIYGPNGTGKTSFSKVLSQDGEYEIDINGTNHTHVDDEIAHVISDQNDRNIIEGETQDFILGDNIKREYELKTLIDNGFEQLFTATLPKTFKDNFSIKTKKSPFEHLITDETIKRYVSDIANTKSKGKEIDKDEFITYISSLTPVEITESDPIKLRFFISEYSKKESAIKSILEHQFEMNEAEKHIVHYEEKTDAISIIEKYRHMSDCLVCDSAIDTKSQLQIKTLQRDESIAQLDKATKIIAEQIINTQSSADPFLIKDKLRTALNSNDKTVIDLLIEELTSYQEIYFPLISNEIIEQTSTTNLKEYIEEYQELKKEQPKFGSEDILFIEKFLNDCLERKISLSRDSDGNLKLLLGEAEFLKKERQKLNLSNGEQNFLSLAFELLKAKNVDHNLIILDDPISSFDSIYKNKIAFAILKILSTKKAIILTHNTDLIKLLEHQQKNCLNLYYFNNTIGENNGFIEINPKEVKLLLYIHEFLNFLRKDVKNEIADERNFIVAISPFLRGCCQIFGLVEQKNKLTKLMHGYETTKVNLTEIFNQVLGEGVVVQEHILSAEDIIGFDHTNLIGLSPDNYPLLSKTLTHTLNYLFLRLCVEKKLVDNFNVNTNQHDMLTNIISASFKGNSDADVSNRVFFMSRKTLLNEFNHFEMDMNIFQPAIDISNSSLEKEKVAILDKLAEF